MDSDELSRNWRMEAGVGQWKTDGIEPWLGDMIKHVYGGGENQPVGHHGHLLLDSLSLENLDDHIDRELKKITGLSDVCTLEDRGILGPDRVIFDVTSNVGSLVIDRDRLGVSSQSNFSSIRANCCVYRGKWLYELMLNSKGVMQVGWATSSCKFSQEKGVGDTQDSYAYDGNRVRKWNVSTYKYGEPWLTSDIIGCAIDLDEGTVGFYRNGKYLGEAFHKVRIGPGMAYFPAVSLAYNENLVANFGSTPLRYPVKGYSHLQLMPSEDVLKTEKLLIWLSKLLQFYPSAVKEKFDPSHPVFVAKSWPPKLKHGSKAEILLLATPLIRKLGPLLTSAFIVEECLLPFLFKLRDEEQKNPESHSRIVHLLDILWALMEPHELQLTLEYLVLALLTGYKFSPATTDFCEQKRFLLLTKAILEHTVTRQYLLQNVLFDKIKFPVLLEIKPFDDEVLRQVVPDVWLETGESLLEKKDSSCKASYNAACSYLRTVIKEVESIQLQILIQLFNGSDAIGSGLSSRNIFLCKFRDFLRENSGGTRVPLVHLCPLPVALAFFHRLIALLRFYYSKYGLDINTAICVPTYIFRNSSDDCLEIQRIGGLQSHLLKTFDNELHSHWDLFTNPTENEHTNPMKLDDERRDPVAGILRSDPASHPRSSSQQQKNTNDLVALMDGIIRLYHIAAHRQLEKMCALRDSMQEYSAALQDVEERIRMEQDDVKELLQAKQVFLNKLTEQGRHHAWLSSVVYSPEREQDVYLLLQVLLRSLFYTSDLHALFAFVPDFYVEACIKCANALRTFFHSESVGENLIDYQDTLVQYGRFLACHFADPRVVNAELKDSLIQALASYVCYPSTLQALEKIDYGSRMVMTQSLLQPYENRAWAQSNWILIRLWKGCGFAFRYSVPPHLSKRSSFKSPSLTDSPPTCHQKPCPSPIFLEHICKWLLENPDQASTFLSSILSQLNWAFSEFIGMLQEIQNACNRPERVFIDSRQLKICATCFDLTLGLLRVLEMTAHLVPQLYTDWSKPSSEIFLTRLCQLLCQVLNRVTSRSGCFCLVVSMEIPGLEVVDHFPILSAVTGILISLLLDGEPESRECAIAALLSEPSFQATSLDFLLGCSKETKNSKPFSFRDYEEVSVHEIEQVETLIQLLHSRYTIAQQNRQSLDIDDEKVCTICYANEKTAIFYPCQHQSCRSCISVHLLQHKECFFCKTIIDNVQF